MVQLKKLVLFSFLALPLYFESAFCPRQSFTITQQKIVSDQNNLSLQQKPNEQNIEIGVIEIEFDGKYVVITIGQSKLVFLASAIKSTDVMPFKATSPNVKIALDDCVLFQRAGVCHLSFKRAWLIEGPRSVSLDTESLLKRWRLSIQKRVIEMLDFRFLNPNKTIEQLLNINMSSAK